MFISESNERVRRTLFCVPSGNPILEFLLRKLLRWNEGNEGSCRSICFFHDHFLAFYLYLYFIYYVTQIQLYG